MLKTHNERIAGFMDDALLGYADQPASARHAANHDGQQFGRMFGGSKSLRQAFAMIERVAPTDVPVLILGESGCGKELVAQTVHEKSSRSAGPFVPVNCGAISPTLLEAELFGYEKGAFAGAQRTHAGVFERAAGGTLFLDEITAMSPDLQARLLRVLETGEFTRLGGTEELTCTARIVAATNRDPAEAISAGALRRDLMFRLAVFPINLPPLRAREGDVLMLARHFLAEMNRQYGTSKKFTAEAEARLASYDWPGNVRELKNCVQRAYILADHALDAASVAPLSSWSPQDEAQETLTWRVGQSLAEMERDAILATLQHFDGDKRQTAIVLGVSLKTLYNRLNAWAAQAS
ncbi:sigma-54 interaction domain-containing protein [Amantichitinum ursilacus]|uniref:Transcriptional regulatory protein ZraR n=1 Tax=Amantichitinum ursilacus TaxID=857265 RepID=A0A0N0GQ78_9NEIS|nr:sigma-54 dependent transcriptional regulator [Amantichitinum ursilacus]KPC54440.1 Transcriptional regulatory protein ZraR [Amantichitinum ursilacus]